MESAREFVYRTYYKEIGDMGSEYLEVFKDSVDAHNKELEARDTAIRKECADRGVKWAMTALGPLIMNSETRDELSAEIMGQED